MKQRLHPFDRGDSMEVVPLLRARHPRLARVADEHRAGDGARAGGIAQVTLDEMAERMKSFESASSVTITSKLASPRPRFNAADLPMLLG